MLLRVPDFYDSFQCIAGKCTDTCCVGWEIDIDEASAKRYASIKSDFGDTLRQNIEDGHFKLLPGDRCPFLLQDGLCEMICRLGESSLCDICREHPRFVEVYGDIMEKGVGLCCEEAVRLLLDAKGNLDFPIAFVEREIDDEPDDIPDDAIEARDAILDERNQLFKLLADHTRPFNERLVEMLDFAIATSGIENSNEITSAVNAYTPAQIQKIWIDILGKGESIGPDWDRAYKEISNNPSTCAPELFSDSDGEKIIAYLLFRYYGKSLFDGNSLAKVQFALFFWVILKKFGSILAHAGHTGTNQASPSQITPQTAKINAIKLLSKQTEYSEEIMGILETEFMENAAFSPDNFKKILME